MRIGIVSNAYFGLRDFRPGMARMRRHGYTCADYQDFMNPGNDLFRCAEPEFERRVREIRSAAEEEGIRIHQTHIPWSGDPCDDENLLRVRYEQSFKAVRGTAYIGSEYIAAHPIMPFGFAREQDAERFMEINRVFFDKLCTDAKDYGVTVCLENMPFPMHPMYLPAHILAFVKELDRDNLRVCLDTGHSVLYENPADAVRLIGKDYLAILHVHDNNGRSDYHTLPFTGVTKWDEFADALGGIGFDGVLSLETSISGHYPPELREYNEIGLADAARWIADRSERARAAGQS